MSARQPPSRRVDKGAASRRAHEERDPQEAVQINVGACSFCDGVHINLIDADGEIFATAVVPCDVGEAFIADFRAAMREIAQRKGPATPRRQ